MSTRVIVLVAGLIAVTGLGAWLHLSIVPDIAWQAADGSVSTGWAAVRNAWPVYGSAGVFLGLLGLAVGCTIGETARERDLRAKTAQAQERVTQAEKTAQTATQEAQEAVSAERADLERHQQQARELVAAAKAARAAADRESQRAQARVGELEAELAEARYRLEHCVAATHRRKRRIQHLEAELATLRSEILP